MARLDFEIVRRETEHVSMAGKRFRSPTVLIRVQRHHISRKAAILGILLVTCHLVDGFLTFHGVNTFGTSREANGIIRNLMYNHGLLPALFMVKSMAVILTLGLTVYAHKRRWVRPLLALSIGLYLTLAIAPWITILSDHSQH